MSSESVLLPIFQILLGEKFLEHPPELRVLAARGWARQPANPHAPLIPKPSENVASPQTSASGTTAINPRELFYAAFLSG